MTEKEKMLAELPYLAHDATLRAERAANSRRLQVYNRLEPDDPAAFSRQLGEILGAVGQDAYIQPPFFCDYGYNIVVGDHFFANANLTILDVAAVVIGDRVQIGPNVGIYTATHPLHPQLRRQGLESGAAIRIGDDVWIGGHVVINPGVEIGSGVVIGAGSVVTRDLPPGVIAAGNPCRVLRAITDRDLDFYYKDRTLPHL